MVSQLAFVTITVAITCVASAFYTDSGDYVPHTGAPSAMNIWPGQVPGERPGEIGPEYAM